MILAMRNAIRASFVCVLLSILTACGGGRLVQPGIVEAGDIVIDTPLAWSRFIFPRYQIWTIDGIALNRLVFISSVRNGEHVFLERRATKRRPDGPVYRAGMRPDEIRDLLLDAFSEGGAVGVASGDLKPVRFGDHDGVRFEFSASTDTGLRYRGQALAAERGDTLAIVVWMAPAEFYYDRDVAGVTRLLDSARFKR